MTTWRPPSAGWGPSPSSLPGRVAGTLYSCAGYLGQTNTFAMLVDNPALVDDVCARVTEQNIEVIRRLADTGGDAIIIDDATATADMISVPHFERFSLPYMKALVDEIHLAGLKAIVIYFGAVMDRLDQIASIGADALSVECSMKGYVNDIDAIARRIGNRLSLFANIDPVGVLEQGSDATLEHEIERQAPRGQAGPRLRPVARQPNHSSHIARPRPAVSRPREVSRSSAGRSAGNRIGHRHPRASFASGATCVIVTRPALSALWTGG